jgi:hypothetical protein
MRLLRSKEAGRFSPSSAGIRNLIESGPAANSLKTI